jgi:sulfite reductase beta subunit-like hemoprotein
MADKEVKLTHNEVIKAGNPSLAGDIAATLVDGAVDVFSKDDQQFLKFHGIYQQDDRDVRKQGKHFMLRIAIAWRRRCCRKRRRTIKSGWKA